MAKQQAIPGTEQEDINTAIGSIEESSEVPDEPAATMPPVPADVPIATPRKRRPAPPQSVPSHDLSPFGGPARTATHWGMTKLHPGTGRWDPCQYQEPGSDVVETAWPLEQLSVDEVHARWGNGRYRVKWWRSSSNGGRQHILGGVETTIARPVDPADAPAPAYEPPAPPASATAGLPTEFVTGLRMNAILEEQSTNKLLQLAQLAKVMAGGGGGGLGAAELQLILRDNQEAMARAITASNAALVARLDRLEQQGGDDEDDEPSGAAAAVAAAAPALLKGRGTFAQVMNFLAGNPAIVTAALPSVLDGVRAAAQALTRPPAPAQPSYMPQPVQLVSPPYAPPPPAPAPPPPPPPPPVATPRQSAPPPPPPQRCEVLSGGRQCLHMGPHDHHDFAPVIDVEGEAVAS